MKNIKFLLIVTALFLSGIGGWFMLSTPQSKIVDTTNPQTELIQQLIADYYTASANVDDPFEDDLFANHLVNDQKEYKLSSVQKGYVKEFIQEAEANKSGFLDAKVAEERYAYTYSDSYAYRKHGQVKMTRKEGLDPDIFQDDPNMTLEEVYDIEILEEFPPTTIDDFEWLFIDIQEDRATFEYKYGSSHLEGVVMNINGQWMIASIVLIERII